MSGSTPVKRLTKLALMYVLRYTPLPWRLKRRAIWQAMAKVVVVGVAVIPDGQGRVLMLRTRYSGRWQLPGGTLEQGEDPRAGTLRECREELRAAVTIERLAGVYVYPRGREMLFAFRCAPLLAPPTLSEEHEAWLYARPEEIRWPTGRMVADALADRATVTIDCLRR